MRHPFQPNVRRLWVLLYVTLLVIYMVVPRGPHFLGPGLNSISNLVELFVFVASAPAGLALLLLMEGLGLSLYYFGVGDRFALLVGLSVLGYFQWFYFVPLLYGRVEARPVTLNLSAEATPAPAGVTHPTPPGSLVVGAGPSGRLVIPFDEHGRTPVERVFQKDEDEGG